GRRLALIIDQHDMGAVMIWDAPGAEKRGLVKCWRQLPEPAASAVFPCRQRATRQHYSGKDTQHTEDSSMMPAPLTALEQLFERLEAAMMEGNVDGEHEQASMLASVNEERSRLGKAPVSLPDVQEASGLRWGMSTTPISSPSVALNSFRGLCSPSPLEDELKWGSRAVAKTW